MQPKDSDSYFFRSFLILLLSVIFFAGFKELLPNRIFSETTGTSRNVVVDSMLLDASRQGGDPAQSGAEQSTSIVFEKEDGVQFPPESSATYSGFQFLIPFYKELARLEQTGDNHVRIAYFGDSMTDGDMIVQDFRAMFQQRFGGLGVGFVPVISESASSRSSVTHQFSSNWKSQNLLNVKWPLRSFGITGHVFFANDTTSVSSVSFKAGRRQFTSELVNPTLYYGSSSNRRGYVTFHVNGDTIKKRLLPADILNVFSLGITTKKMQATFSRADSIPFYGFSFDNGRGVHVDNFSQRGNSGIPLIKFKPALMQEFQKRLGYDLIILQYGTNVLNYGTRNFSWYGRSISKTIKQIRSCFPNVPILVVSTADKGTKYELEMKTDSAVIPLVRAQRDYAIGNKLSFVNLYTLMGGDGSMVRWVEGEPPMANKDYTHFNFRGSEKVGSLLFHHIIGGYEQYRKLSGSSGQMGNRNQSRR